MNRLKLNRDCIKFIAMFTMFCNHGAHVFLEPGTLLFTVLVDAGYFTAPVMCWFLVEGYHYTRSRKRYAQRLAVFALLSQFPFCYALSASVTGRRGLSFIGFNMMFTLLLCFGILVVQEEIRKEAVRILLISGLILLSFYSDWALMAPVFTLLFSWGRGDATKTRQAFAAGTLLFVLLRFPVDGSGADLAALLGSACSIAAAGAVLVCFYNGRQMKRGRKMLQWFFYLFYPLHLLFLGMIRDIFFRQ